MKRDVIDFLDGIDVSQLTFADIRVLSHSFRSESSGSERNKTYKSRSGVLTEIGDIKDDIWRQLAEELVKRAGEEKYMDWFMKYIGAFQYMKHEPESKRKDEALSMIVSRIFEKPEWVSFIQFNEVWRPEALTGVEIIEVITPCCKKAGRVTAQQIDREAGTEKVSCPTCGRKTIFQRV